jgi:hypothetical protein
MWIGSLRLVSTGAGTGWPGVGTDRRRVDTGQAHQVGSPHGLERYRPPEPVGTIHTGVGQVGIDHGTDRH